MKNMNLVGISSLLCSVNKWKLNSPSSMEGGSSRDRRKHS